MTWYGLLALLIALGGAVVLWTKLYSGKWNVTHCCGCGECVRTGECVMVKGRKPVKKGEDPS